MIQKKNSKEQGFVLVALLTIVPVWAIGLSALLQSTIYGQQRLALWFRLDACALKIMKQRGELLETLEASNRRIDALLLFIYAARSAKPVPVVGWMAGLTEPAAVVALHASVRIQDLQMLEARARLLSQLQCSANEFSKAPSYCRFPTPPALQRKRPFFPDLSGPLLLDPLYSFYVRCGALGFPHRNPPVTTLQLVRSPKLGYRYVE